jgi:maleate isomerase
VAQSQALKAKLEAHAGVPVILGSEAVAAGLNAFGAKSIAVLTPHMPKGDAEVQGWLEEAGLCRQAPDRVEMRQPAGHCAGAAGPHQRGAGRRWTATTWTRWCRWAPTSPVRAVAAEMEPRIGKPVIQINTVSAWAALRGAGIADKVQGRGRILEEH